MNKIYLGMGCFWSAQHIFQKYMPEKNINVGYIDGIEVVEIPYHSSELDKILKIFYENHSFSIKEIPQKYKSTIFFTDKNDYNYLKLTFNYYNMQIKKSGNRGYHNTEIKLLTNFIIADEHHQNYLKKNPDVHCVLGFNGVEY